MNILKPCSLAIVLAFWSESGVNAEFITSLNGVSTLRPDGLFQYDYVITNSPDSDRAVASFTLDVSSNSDLQLPVGPVGWDIFYVAGDSSILWESTDASFDILPGANAAFSFFSPLGPATLSYLIVGLGTNPVIDFNEGQIVAPAATAIPEPSTLLLGTSALLSVLGYSLRHARMSR